jgi:ankyrin repeat protein
LPAAPRQLAPSAAGADAGGGGGRSLELTHGERDKAARAALGPAAARAKGEQLLQACFRREGAAALRLISEGADPDCVDEEGSSPLMYTIRLEYGLDGVAARLIAAGVKLDLVDSWGYSALIHACYYKRAATALLLVEAGAAPHQVNNDGKSALDYAGESGLEAVAAAIRARGGRTGAELKALRAAAAAPLPVTPSSFSSSSSSSSSSAAAPTAQNVVSDRERALEQQLAQMQAQMQAQQAQMQAQQAQQAQQVQQLQAMYLQLQQRGGAGGS